MAYAMRTRCFVTLLFSFIISCAIAQQGIIAGTIIQSDSSSALPGASVYLHNTNLGSATNTKGRYEIKDVPPGQYTLVVSCIGYFSQRSEIMVRAHETVLADFTMTEAIPSLAEITIMTGGSLGVRDIPGSVHYVSPREIQRFNYTDINRTLRAVPGINIQEEDGFGLRPNIGLRGTGVERTSKITVMEDGVLMSPAPYSAPAAYYFPTIGRMQAVEVLKGTSQIKYGPFTTGGAINLISTYIPHEFGGRLSLLAGSYGSRNVHAFAGNSHKNFGYVAETFQYSADGFKQLDGGGDTGFDKKDYLVKFRVNTNPGARIYQALTLKAVHATEISDETYLGLTRADFDLMPRRRYTASQKDVMTTQQSHVTMSHVIQFPRSVSVTTTVYYTDFARNWYKLDKVKNSDGANVGIAALLDNPNAFGDAYHILTGQSSTVTNALEVKANNRTYASLGVQSTLRAGFNTGRMVHSLETGLRYHEDEADRFQWSDFYAMDNGVMKLSTAGIPGTESNRIESANAIAAFVQNRVRIGSLSVTPGFRFEHITMSQGDFGRNDPKRTGSQLATRSNTVHVLIPGIGADYRFSDALSVFAGVHRGFAPPGSDDETKPEKSFNSESGLRYFGEGISGQLVGFFSDYSNLLGSDLNAAGGAGTGDLFNGGAVHAGGIEALLTWDLIRGNTTSLRVPFTLVYTYTNAIFLNAFASTFEGWGTVGERDELPYLAHHQLTAMCSAEHDLWSVNLSARYTSAMRTEPGQGAIPADARTDAALIVDVSVGYQLHRQINVFASVHNATDRVYVVAQRPAGLRPGMPRAVNAGLRVSF